MAQTAKHVGSGGRQQRLRCQLTLALMRAVEKVCTITSPITSGTLLVIVGFSALGELAFLFTRVVPCACLSLNVSFVWRQPSC